MQRWVTVSVTALALAGGGALIAAQAEGAPAPAVAEPASADEDNAASPTATAFRSALAEDPVAPRIAPKNYDATIILFADYQCPYCRKIHPELERLIHQDKQIRLVYRDWPIFGEPSIEAARAAIASQWQGKHTAFDDALMTTSGKLDSAKIKAAANKAGVDWARLQADLKKHRTEIDGLLARTGRGAERMGLEGTPALLIGPYFVPGALDYGQLIKAVAMARAFNVRHPKAAAKRR
jgi:protein-disulfide isomerase